MSADTTPRRSFLDRQRDRALELISEQTADRRRVEEIVVGPDHRHIERATTIIKLSEGDYLVEVTDSKTDKKKWAVVVGNTDDSWRFYTQNEAMLYAITRRLLPRGDVDAVTYAARVLGLTLTD